MFKVGDLVKFREEHSIANSESWSDTLAAHGYLWIVDSARAQDNGVMIKSLATGHTMYAYSPRLEKADVQEG